MSIGQRASAVLRHLFALGEGELQWGRGVRTAFALIVPVVAGDLLAQPLFTWAALGGWLGSLADKGGSYRARATTMGAFAILGAACALGGTEAAGSIPVAVASMLVVGILGGLGRVYGDEGSTVGLFIAIIFAVALGAPSHVPHAALVRGVLFLGGVAWAMVLSLLFWPLHPFRPARRVVAGSYRALAELALALEEVSTAIGDRNAGIARTRARALHASVRTALERARMMIADMRRPKQGRSARGEQLLVLNEGAEQLFGTLVAIEAEIEAAHESGSTAGDEAFRNAFGCLAKTLDLLTTAIDDTIDSRRRAGERLPVLLDLSVRTDWPNVHLRAAATLLSRLANDVQLLVDTASRIDVRAAAVVPTTAESRTAQPAAALDPLAWLRPLGDALTPRSLPAQHALRMGIAAAAAVGLSYALDITRGYWATITALIVLQPYTGATMRKTLQRVGGSVLGGIIAAALAVVARTKLAIAGVMVPFTIGAVAVLSLNYGVFVLLLTPVFVLLAEPHPGEWGVAGLRVANTMLGGAIALAASQLLWPTHELSTYATQLANVLRQLRALLAIVTSPADTTTPAWLRRVDETRRRFGVAVSNAEATMQRLITEDAPNPHRVEAAMALLTYGRRMASTLSAIAASRATAGAFATESVVMALAVELDAIIAPLDRDPSAPTVAPAVDDASKEYVAADDITASTQLRTKTLQAAQLDRLHAQLAVMDRAVKRYVAA
ncbi:MAG: FUSC family protein [Gemmatimonadota bacterium]|nr:FUSC family protein [Gemmatimonadota bacterium]